MNLKKVWKNSGIRLVLPIHDEKAISFPRKMIKHKKEILGTISKLMIDIPEINVPLDVEWKYTPTTWDKAKGVTVEY